jgi:hypothetical protein
MRLVHISEEGGIERFTPRPAKPTQYAGQAPVVWAVAAEGRWSYLVPRDCPRIYAYAIETSTVEDVERFLDGDRAKRVLTIEAAWFERACTTILYEYEFRLDDFWLHDATARYYLSGREQLPISQRVIVNPLQALVEEGVEVRITPSLWELRERVYRSSLAWGFIRMRNAAPPAQGYEAFLPL